MKKATATAIRRHAVAAYPRESVGFIVSTPEGKEKYIRGENAADAAQDGFVTRAEDWAAAEDAGVVIGFVHSHPDARPEPSEADLVACESMAMQIQPTTWHIVEVRLDIGQEVPEATTIHSFDPSGYVAPLVGRTFHHGILDCYTLIQDFYQRELGVTLPDFQRDDGWWNGEQEVYLENFAAAGFRPLRGGEKIQRGDVILMQHLSDRTNHGAVYLGDGSLTERPDLFKRDGMMLHHLYGRLSEREVYGGHWANITRMILRHEGGGHGGSQ